MRVHQTLICFFFLKLTDGLYFHEDIGVREGTEGGNIEVGCSFTFSGSRKVFCRNDCEDEDILCETTDVSAQCGRYSIESGLNNAFYVSITNLRKSDSGSYTCWLDRNLSPDSTETFELRVKEAITTSKPSTTPKPSSTRSTSTLTTAQTVSSSSGSTTTSPHSPNTTTTSSHSPNTTTTEQLSSASGSGFKLLVRLILVFIFIVSSAAVLIVCRRRTTTPEESHVELDYVNINHDDQEHDEIGEEDRQSGLPPVETSTL